jgi:hypothetical protein
VAVIVSSLSTACEQITKGPPILSPPCPLPHSTTATPEIREPLSRPISLYSPVFAVAKSRPTVNCKARTLPLALYASM